MEYKERLQEFLLYFLCRAGVYPFIDDIPCFEFLKSIRGFFLDFPLPDNDDELMTLLTDTLLCMQDRGLIILGEADYVIPLRDYAWLSDSDLNGLRETIAGMIDYDRTQKYPMNGNS